MSHPTSRRWLALGAFALIATTAFGAVRASNATSESLAASPSTAPVVLAVADAETQSSAAVAQSFSAPAETAPALSGDEARRHVTALSDTIGSRVAGTDNQRRAADYLAEQFRALGYATTLQPFTITSYDDRGSMLELGGAGGQAIAATTLQSSTGGAIDAELVDGGLGRPGELASAGVAGKIVLVERGELRFSEKVANAERAGAVGIVVYNNQPGPFTGNLTAPSAIPAIGIAQADGRALSDRLGPESIAARVGVNASTESRTAQNVIASRPGGPQTVVFGGHFDSVEAGPGANDNASGTAVVLELARVMAARPTPFTLTFAAFDAEEIGLLGSAHMVGQLSPDEVRSMRAMINLDMVGVGDAARVGGDAALATIAKRVSADLGQQAGSLGEVGGGSDHASFTRVGVPALFIHRTNDPNYHSPNDRSKYVTADNLQFAGQLALGVHDALAAGR